jgi:hypothetical protein
MMNKRSDNMKRFIFCLLFFLTVFAFGANTDYDIKTDWGHIDDFHFPDTIYVVVPTASGADTTTITPSSISSSTGIMSIGSTTTGVIKGAYDVAAYWTATQADGGGVTLNSVSDGTAGFTFSDPVTVNLATGTGLTVSGTPTKVLSAGSYGSKLNLAEGATIEMVTIAGEQTEDDFLIGYGSYLRTTGEDGKPFGASFLVEATNTTGTPTLEGAQIMAFLGSVGGSEAAVLKTRGGDATAGMYSLWLKTGANNNCVFNSGSRTAPLWVDNQCGGTHNGEEYGIFSSTGMSRPDAWAGFETTSSGYDQLLYFDETFNSGAGHCVTTDAVPATQDARINVYYNATQYYIPLYR